MSAGRSPKPRRILVTGGAGYLGSVVVRHLIHHDFQVRVLDSFPFGEESLESVRANPNCKLIRGDVRDAVASSRAMLGCDAVVHLAAIVGDPACDANPQVALDVNLTGTRSLIRSARECGIRRLIFASSCSVYGASDALLDETSPLNPLSIYARTKIEAEKFLLGARNGSFSPVVLRFGTLFGLSPQMRFDLVVNLFVARAAATGQITVFNEEQWRPFLHVEDAARAVVACLEAATPSVSGEIFNAGSPRLNLQIRDVGDAVRRVIPDTVVERIENYSDRRNYRVSFAKIQRALGFEPRRALESGIEEIYAAIRSELVAEAASHTAAAQPLVRPPHLPHKQLRSFRQAAASR
jgi:nucleoside-diphosphate-sugar epimerase